MQASIGSHDPAPATNPAIPHAQGHDALVLWLEHVAASALLTLLSSGMRLSIGPFFLPIAQDVGFSRSLLASIVAVGMICYGLAMPLAGWLIARLGTRAVLLASVVIVDVASAPRAPPFFCCRSVCCSRSAWRLPARSP